MGPAVPPPPPPPQAVSTTAAAARRPAQCFPELRRTSTADLLSFPRPLLPRPFRPPAFGHLSRGSGIQLYTVAYKLVKPARWRLGSSVILERDAHERDPAPAGRVARRAALRLPPAGDPRGRPAAERAAGRGRDRRAGRSEPDPGPRGAAQAPGGRPGHGDRARLRRGDGVDRRAGRALRGAGDA